MVHTDKIRFESTTDWIQVTDADLVFSGTVNFVHNDWTTITLDTPFNYDGQHNVALIVDDNTGSYGETTNFLCTYDLHSNYDRAMFYYNDNTNYDPKGTPGAAEGRTNRKCQIRIMKVVNFTEEIAGYGTGNGKWHLVASPFASPTDPTDVTNMLSNEYDLYRFNHSAALEWENWKATGTDHYHFNLESGRGYLYANSADVTLGFCGVPYCDNGQVTLSKDANASLGEWNLIGNPFSTNATLGSKPFYIMNSGGTDIITATRSYVKPMEGIFVEANSDGEIVTFTAQARDGESANEDLVLNLSQGGPSTGSGTAAVIDRAIVRFGEGETLHKLQIRDGNTKVYIPQDNEEYAIVSVGRDVSGNVSTMPVNFRAAENGTYTLTISATPNSQLSTLNYLHLIDNMTGADIDLLNPTPETLIAGSDPQSPMPSYTFTAKTTDYESRFMLLFMTNGASAGSASDATFAFCSNGNWIIANEGRATLQVIDVNGRILSSEQINGCAETHINAAPGVYVIRLINGENVRTQKVVVR